MKKALEYKRLGQLVQAQRKFSEAIDITPEMANLFIKILKDLKIEFYIAPYEADAQLAYFYNTGKI